MQSNYGGDPAGLEAALRGFLPMAREMVARQPQQIGDDILRTLILTSLASRRLARRDPIESAVDAILQAQRQAA